MVCVRLYRPTLPSVTVFPPFFTQNLLILVPTDIVRWYRFFWRYFIFSQQTPTVMWSVATSPFCQYLFPSFSDEFGIFCRCLWPILTVCLPSFYFYRCFSISLKWLIYWLFGIYGTFYLIIFLSCLIGVVWLSW